MPVQKQVTLLDNVQRLYEANEFLTAYSETKHLWQPSTSLAEFSTDELVLAARLATRLGGRRLSRWLFYEALKREPHNPKVRYFAGFVHQRECTLLNHIRNFPTQQELDSFAQDLRVSYLASHAVLLASVRDFSSAHEYIRRAYAVGSDNAWAASCHSDVLGMEDKWHDAIKPAEDAWTQNGGAPYAAHSLGNALLHLGRIEESAERLGRSARQMQSYEVAHIACWHQSALAETLDGEARRRAALEARALAETLPALAPLADREAKWTFARTQLDIAMLIDDQQEIERWVHEVKSPFHRAVLDNLKGAKRRSRIRLSHRRTIQKHQACLPTSMVSVLSAFGADLDPDQIARQITFGGTADWAAAEWLEKNGYVVRFFIATPQVAQQLISNGIPFVLTLEWDYNAHAVAVIGMDEGTGTLLVHDPQEFRSTEYLLDSLNSMRAPLGPRAMAAVPLEKVALLDELLPSDTVELMTAAIKHQQSSQEEYSALAREIVARITEKLPLHPGTKCLQAFQARSEGRTGVALQIFQKLYSDFPGSAAVRSGLMAAYRSAGDSALLRSALRRIVEDRTIPGIEAHQTWIYPPARYICEYADQLRQSAETAHDAEKRLHSVLRRAPATAEAWHILADLLWTKHDREAALLCYRFGSCLAPSYEHYALAYCDALGNCGRKDEGLAWLEERVRAFGHSFAAIETWLSWIGALENWGYPERALNACEEALAMHSTQPELLGFVVGLLARMGDWDRAAKRLAEIPNKESPIYLESAMEFHRMRGELGLAMECAEQLVGQAPGSTSAKQSLLALMEARDGSVPTVELAQHWLEENPGNDYLEQLYLSTLD
ncbi:MAG TPA: C39 family peptidase, partial [Terriglobales bacterium]|nr:C39 family peptidase [Terriglobales bacterium]